MTYAPVDPDSPKYGKGMIFRQTNIPFLQAGAKKTRRAVEAGYTIIMKKKLNVAGFTLDFGDTKMNWDNFRDCMSPTLVMDKPAFQAAHLANYRSLAIYVACFFLISLAILSMEKVTFTGIRKE